MRTCTFSSYFRIVCLAVLFCMGLAVMCLVVLPVHAYAATYAITHTSGTADSYFANSGSNVNLDRSKLNIRYAQFSTTNSSIVRSWSYTYASVAKSPYDSTLSSTPRIMYDCGSAGALKNSTFKDGNSHKVSGTVTLKWENVGSDSAGYPIDAQITLSNIYLGINLNLAGAKNWNPRYLSIAAGSVFGGSTSGSGYASFDCSVKMFRHGTSTAASGNFLFAMKDLDAGYNVAYKYTATGFREGVCFQSGFVANSLKLPSNDRLYTTGDVSLKSKTSCDGCIWSQPKHDPSGADDYTCGFSILGAASGISFRWQGFNCGTDFFEDNVYSRDLYAHATVTVDGVEEASFASSYGKLTCSGGTAVSGQTCLVKKKATSASFVYAFTVPEGYYIDSVYAGSPDDYASLMSSSTSGLSAVSSTKTSASYTFSSTSKPYNKVVVNLKSYKLTVRYHYNLAGAGPNPDGDGIFEDGDPCKVSVYTAATDARYGLIDATADRAVCEGYVLLPYYTRTTDNVEAKDNMIPFDVDYGAGYSALTWAKDHLVAECGCDADFSDGDKVVDVYMQWNKIYIPSKDVNTELPLTGGTDWQTSVMVLFGLFLVAGACAMRIRFHEGR